MAVRRFREFYLQSKTYTDLMGPNWEGKRAYPGVKDRKKALLWAKFVAAAEKLPSWTLYEVTIVTTRRKIGQSL